MNNIIINISTTLLQDNLLLIIIVFLVLILGLTTGTILKIRKSRMIRLFFNDVASKKGFNIKVLEKEIADFELENEDVKLVIKLVYVPRNSSITINSKTTWNLRYGGTSGYGKNYSQKRYLNELIPFLKHEVNSSSRKTQKVIVVYPSTNKIEKYLNESDIAIIKNKDISYGYKVIRFIDFEENFSDLL